MSSRRTEHSSVQRLLALGLVSLAFAPALAAAAYRDDIGYAKLQSELGSATPAGAGVPVTQVESNQLMDPNFVYMPETGNADFTGKSFTDASAKSTTFSQHATVVGQFFYGTTQATARGITSITGYLVDNWLTSGFLRIEGSVPGNNPQPNISSSRIVNHSWIGTFASTTNDYHALRRVDWLVNRDEFVQVVAYTGAIGSPLLSSAFNVIAVDRTGATTTGGSAAVDATYTGGRTRPDLVAPADSPSNATPIVTSAAALLIGFAQSNSALSTDLVSTSTSNRNQDTIYNASRSEVLKAALMAGADRSTHNTADTDLTDYRVNPADQTANGLDRHYGAGQLNIRNSYWIIASGEQNSTQDAGPGSGSATRGFDYDPHFGGSSGANSVADYPLPVSATPQLLTASLVWNLYVSTQTTFSGTTTLRDLALSVRDVTNPVNPVTVFTSQNTTENTENAWLVIPAGAHYALQVMRGSGSSFDFDYALAWQLLPDTDADGAYDEQDNCIDVANGPMIRDAGDHSQLDADGDGYGNMCDGDLNNSGLTTATDFNIIRNAINTNDPVADMNGNGLVTATDFNLLRARLNAEPGPSGLLP